MTTFYKFFDERSDEGYVFYEDFSSDNVSPKVLTSKEVKQRRAWNKNFDVILNEYLNTDSNNFPTVTTPAELLAQRLIAPKLQIENITTRTTLNEPRAGRMYPPSSKLCMWDSFEHDVANYELPGDQATKQLRINNFMVFRMMLDDAQHKKGSEDDERQYIIKGLRFLERAEIVSEIQVEKGPVVGRPDFCLQSSGEKISVVAECKSTHNLLMPPYAEDIVRKYLSTYDEVITRGPTRTHEWSHIAHPLGQLLGYMCDNKKRYGALTSATRTYFVFISGSNDIIQVNISDAYYVGKINYLRAWAYIHSLGCQQDDEFVLPTSGEGQWVRTDKDHPSPQSKQQPNPDTRKRKSTKSNRNRNSKRHKKSANTMSLQHVDFKELSIGNVLGIGRNGTVFKVAWKGETYALKQFDIRKDGEDGFQKELVAYARTQAAWGKLVPKPFFVSETPSGGVKLLGLQLGRNMNKSEVEDPDIGNQCNVALDTLRDEYGIDHNDPGNAIMLKSDGRDRVAIIDFEDWNDVQ